MKSTLGGLNRELAMAEQLIASLEAPFEPEKFRDLLLGIARSAYVRRDQLSA